MSNRQRAGEGDAGPFGRAARRRTTAAGGSEVSSRRPSDRHRRRQRPRSPDALRILIVDDHAARRSALRDLLQQRPQLSVVGDAANGFEAIAHAHTLRPDVILMDVAMPQMDGVEATARIRAELPDIQILGLSMQPRSAASTPSSRPGPRHSSSRAPKHSD